MTLTQIGGHQIVPANRNVADIVKLMDTSHTGYLTVMVRSLEGVILLFKLNYTFLIYDMLSGAVISFL